MTPAPRRLSLYLTATYTQPQTEPGGGSLLAATVGATASTNHRVPHGKASLGLILSLPTAPLVGTSPCSDHDDGSKTGNTVSAATSHQERCGFDSRLGTFLHVTNMHVRSVGSTKLSIGVYCMSTDGCLFLCGPATAGGDSSKPP